MSAESALRALLVADTAVAALVQTRVAVDRMEEGAVFPFVVFARTGTQPITALDGTHLRSQASLEVQCWAETRLGADALADAVAAAVRGVISQTVPGRASGYDADTDRHVCSLQVAWWE